MGWHHDADKCRYDLIHTRVLLRVRTRICDKCSTQLLSMLILLASATSSLYYPSSSYSTSLLHTIDRALPLQTAQSVHGRWEHNQLTNPYNLLNTVLTEYFCLVIVLLLCRIDSLSSGESESGDESASGRRK